MRNSIQIFVSIALLVYISTSCINKTEYLDIDEYVNYVKSPKSKLLQQKTFDNITFTIQYQPAEYEALKEIMQLDSQFNSEKYYSVLKNKKDFYFFQLRIINKNNTTDFFNKIASSSNEVLSLTNYYSFDFQQKLKLVEDNDTLMANACQFINYYGISPFIDFVMVFPKIQKKKISDLTLIIDDEVFQLGNIKFQYSANCIKRIPKLKTK